MKHITDLTAAAAEAKHADYKPVNVYMYAGITIIENIHKQMHVRRSLQSLFLYTCRKYSSQPTTADLPTFSIYSVMLTKKTIKPKNPRSYDGAFS